MMKIFRIEIEREKEREFKADCLESNFFWRKRLLSRKSIFPVDQIEKFNKNELKREERGEVMRKQNANQKKKGLNSLTLHLSVPSNTPTYFFSKKMELFLLYSFFT